jgi:hypothetical protein
MWQPVFAQVEVFRCCSGALFGADSNAIERHAVQASRNFPAAGRATRPAEQRLKRKRCTKRRMRQCSEKSRVRDLAAVEAAIRRGKNFQTRCWRDRALSRRAWNPDLECAAAIGLLLRVRHRDPC